MGSPLSDVVAKRRYHKHRHHMKKKSRDRVKHNYGRDVNKISSNKANEPVVRITHRRLTNKSGFPLKGAVVTSPVLRGSKNRSAQKAAKRSVDYDLQCILRAAKGRDLSSECHSSSESIHPGGSIDSPNTMELPLEKERKIGKSLREITQFAPVIVPSHSSSDKNITTLDDNQNYEVGLQTDKTSSSNPSEIYQRGNHDSKVPKCEGVNLNPSNETNNAYQRKMKPYSFSAYQKFAVGIVEALHAEKKKQYPLPDFDWLKGVTQDLDIIYHKTRGKQSQTCLEQFLPERKYENIPSNVSVELTRVGKLDIREEKVKPVFQNESRPEIQPVPESAGHLEGKEDNVFREGRVKAWINAIPVHVSNVDKKENQRKQKPINQIMQLDTEREFLRNFNNKSLCNAKPLNSFENVENSFNSFNWAVKSSNVFGHSVPFNAPTKAIKLKCTKRPIESSHTIFPQTELACHQRKEPRVIWGSISPQPAKHPQNPQQSWMNWFKDGCNNPSAKEKSQTTEVPLSLSPFDAPAPNVGRHIREDCEGKENAKRRNNTSQTPFWCQFPKLFKKDKNKSAEITNGFDFRRGNHKNPKQSPANTDFIKFSPRNMF